MTRIKKLLVAGLMAVVTFCVSIGSAIINIGQSLFSLVSVGATTNYDYSNTNTGVAYKTGHVVQVENIPSTGKVGTGINIPKSITVFDTTDLDTPIVVTDATVDIKNPYGDSIVSTSQVEVVGDNYVLTPSQVGVYTVQYAYNNGNVWTISDVYSIQVTKEAYTLELEQNNPIVLPKQIDTNQGVSTTVKLPLPLVYDENGEQITKLVLGGESDEYYYVAEYKDLAGKTAEHEYVVVLDETTNAPVVYDYANEESKAQIPADRNVYDSYKTYVITKVNGVVDTTEIKYGLYVEAYNTTSTISNFKTGAEDVSMPLNYAGTGGQNYTATTAYSFEAGAGKNIVRYRLCKSDMSNYTTPYAYLNDVTIEGTTNLDNNEISVGASTTTNVVYSDTSLMDKCYLPKVNAVDKNNNSNSLNAYYYYEVEYVGDLSNTDTSDDAIKSKDNKYVSLGIDENGLYFIPKVKGTYNIYYNAKDFYNKTDANAEKYDYDVVITDRVAPTMQLTQSYDMAKLDQEATKKIVSEDYSYAVPTKYYTSSDTTDSTKWTTIAVPAIYATDSVLSFDNLTITRSITSENGFKNISTFGEVKNNYTIEIQNQYGETTNNVTVKTNADGDTEELKNIVNFEAATAGVYTDFYITKDANGKAIFYNNDGTEMESGTVAYKKAKTSQVAYITLNPNLFGEGKYTIRFNVADKNGTSANNTGDSFTFELVYADSADDVDTQAPTVEFTDDAIVEVIDNEQITINKPTIKDDVDTGSSKNSNRAVTLNRYYVLIENAVNAESHTNTFVPLTLTEDNKLTFNMADKADGVNTIYELAVQTGKFKVVCFSYDDFANYAKNPATDANFADDFTTFEANTGDYAHVGYGEFEITVKNVYDNVAPKFDSRTATPVDYTDVDGYNQYSVAEVKGIVFYDNSASDKITVKVLDSQGNSYAYEELEGSKIEKNADATYKYKYTFAGIKFTATKADSYTINYVVTDEGNNTMCYAFVLVKAGDKETPVITEVLGITDSMELGTSKQFTVKATDNTATDITYQVKVLDQDGRNMSFAYFNTENMTFTPKAVGTYTIQIKAVDDADNVSEAESFKIKVSDTLAPVIEYFGNQSIEAITELERNATNNSNGDTVDWEKVFPEVTLPGFTITDSYQNKNGFAGVFGANGTLTITTPNSDSYTITNSQTTIEGENPLNIKRDGANFYFTPTARGEYKVVYSGTDNAGNTASNEKTITVNIGDTQKPVIKLSDNMLNTLKNGFVLGNNAELLVNTKVLFDSVDNLKTSKTNGDVYLTDNFGFKNLGDGSANSEVYTNVSVQVLDANNNNVSSTTSTNEATGVEYKKFEFTTAGTYTINITATDSVGNSYTLAKTFKVSAVEASASESSKVLGTVLIVVSIVILAGVVIYFVRGTKFLPKRKKAKKEKVEKPENKD